MYKPLKAISLIQPWATLVMLGIDVKHFETRSWSTKHRGPLAIHASKQHHSWDRTVGESNKLLARALHERGLEFDLLPRGAILGVVELVDVHPITAGFTSKLTPMELSAGDYSLEGRQRYAWQCEDVRNLVTPIPCNGSLSLWQVPEVTALFMQSRLYLPSNG